MKPFIHVKVNSIYHKIDIEQIVFVKAEGNYCHIFTSNTKNYMVYIGLKQMGEMLMQADLFVLANRSYLVNVNYVDTFSHLEGIHLKVSFDLFNTIPLSQNGLDALLKFSVLEEVISA